MTPRREVISIDGWDTSYLVAGEGPPLLMIPGWLQTAQLWLDAGYVDRFSDSYRVIVVDLLGHGESDRPEDESAYGPEVMAHHLVSVLEAEASPPAAVWGYSTAADYAVILARRRPDLVARMVVGGQFLGDPLQRHEAAGRSYATMVQQGVDALESGDWEEYFRLVRWTAAPEYKARIVADHDPAIVAVQLRSELLRARGFLMPGVPTLAYWGDEEEFHLHNLERAPEMPIEWSVVPGDRGGAFMKLDPVVQIVRPFLEAPASA